MSIRPPVLHTREEIYDYLCSKIVIVKAKNNPTFCFVVLDLKVKMRPLTRRNGNMKTESSVIYKKNCNVTREDFHWLSELHTEQACTQLSGPGVEVVQLATNYFILISKEKKKFRPKHVLYFFLISFRFAVFRFVAFRFRFAL